jgi:ABC-2 type transport system ATP-binding protein
LIFLTRLRGLSKADAEKNVVYWMKKFQIESWWNKKVNELSKGMSQKVQFIATVSHQPKLIILDEPFSGLDPINTNLIKEEIQRLKNEGSSILFSTHRMEQVEEMCEQIVLINKGKIVLNGEVNEVRNRYKEHVFEISTESVVPESIKDHFEIISGDDFHFYVRLKENQNNNEILKWLLSQNVLIKSFQEVLPTFNEIFIKTVNETNHD